MTFNKLDFPTADAMFALTDDGAGGGLQTAKRRLKFRLRYMLCDSQLRRLHAFFQDRGLGALAHTELNLILRPMRPYLWQGLKAEGRMQAVQEHFDWLLGRCSPDVVVNFFRRDSHTYFSQTYPEGTVSIQIKPGRALGREGEFELHLKFNEMSVMRSAFSVLPSERVGVAQPGFVMVIGSMQGKKSLQQEIKIVTQKMERTRPQNILMTALQGLATSWQLVGMLGVSDFGHVYASYRSLSKRVGQNYDTLWAELGATEAVSKLHWNLPIEWVARSEQDVPSSKRSQLRRKNEIRQKIFDEIISKSHTL